jgi:hypothetical protein
MHVVSRDLSAYLRPSRRCIRHTLLSPHEVEQIALFDRFRVNLEVICLPVASNKEFNICISFCTSTIFHKLLTTQ